MRLRLRSVKSAPGKRIQRSLDRYCLFRAGPEGLSGSLPLYWRLMDTEFSLVEVAIEPGTGEFRSVAIPLYNGDIPRAGSLSIGSVERGLPVFDVGLWDVSSLFPAGHYVTAEGRCACTLRDGALLIQLFADRIVRTVEPHAGVRLLFNGRDELCGVLAPNLTAAEHRAISASFRLASDQPK